MKILVPEKLSRNVLAAVRTFGRAGHSVTLAIPVRPGRKPPKTNNMTRFVQQITTITSPHHYPDEFKDDLLELIKEDVFDVLLPFTHGTVVPISYYLDELANYVHIPIAPYSRLQRAHDKLETFKLAQHLDIGTPVTFHPNDREDLLHLKEYIPFPCLVKARQGCGVGTTIRFAKKFQELLEGYETIHQQASVPPVNDYTFPIIQEYVPGQIHDAVFLYDRGKCVAALTQERVITYPIQGGPGAVNRTTQDPLLRELGQRLLDALQWHGPAQVEFRLDPRDGQYKLLEINPKFWGTLPLSIVAGINFAMMACDLAYKGEVDPQFDYRVGITYRWLFYRELYSLIQKPTWQRIGQFISFWKPRTYYDFDLLDPVPDMYRAATSIRRALAFNKDNLLPPREDLNELASQRSPAQQPDLLI